MATDAVLSVVIQTIGNLLIEEAKSLYGVSDRVRQLQRELQRLRSFLEDAEVKRHKNKRVLNWIADIRDAAYDAEDVVETYALEVELKRHGGVGGALKRFACLPNEASTLYKIGNDVDEIKNRLSEIAASLEAYGIREAIISEESDSWLVRLREQRQTFPHVVDHDLVGMESSIEKLVTELVDEENKFQVLSICGMGGLGKTTLARKVYQHGKVRNHFDSFAWACISQECQRRDTWIGILKSLSSKSSGDEERVAKRVVKMQDQELVAKLHKVLSKEKCLVVLDDIWTTDTWDRLKAAFPDETRSRIVLTSRNEDVASCAVQKRLLYRPKFLNDDESWELLQKLVFPRRNENSDFKIEDKMIVLGKDMIKKCGGLPLAIRVLGGLLVKRCTLNRWQMIHNNIRSYIMRGIEQEERDSSVDKLLSLSYDELPYQLKNCFLYLALFPEDYQIDVDKLMKLWIAEGFITSLQYDGEQPRRMEDVAELLLDELIDRSMVLIGKTDKASSKVLTCHLHDVMRDFCLLKAKEDGFLQVIGPKDQDRSLDAFSSSSSPRMCRRVTVHLPHDKVYKIPQQDLIRNHSLRSLVYVSRALTLENSFGNWKLSKACFKKFKVLRVLDLERVVIRGGKLPRDIGELVHLRYLSLLWAIITEIPSSLGNLRLLETLDLRVEEKAYVPNVLKKMKRLTHLYLPRRCVRKTKLELGNLKGLQTLENFQLGVCNVRDLLSLTKLETLTVRKISTRKMEMIPPALGSVLENLRSFSYESNYSWRNRQFLDVSDLVSGFTNLSRLSLHVKMEKLPDSSQFPPGITHISLSGCELEEDPMPVLERLQMLRDLDINHFAFMGKEMVCSRSSFPQLRSLTLVGLSNLEEWKLGEGAMPSLHSLTMMFCKKLKALPEALKGIESLQELRIFAMPRSFKDMLVQGGEDFYKIQHVPSVHLAYCDSDDDSDEKPL